jgi:hypothetical protein
MGMRYLGIAPGHLAMLTVLPRSRFQDAWEAFGPREADSSDSEDQEGDTLVTNEHSDDEMERDVLDDGPYGFQEDEDELLEDALDDEYGDDEDEDKVFGNGNGDANLEVDESIDLQLRKDTEFQEALAASERSDEHLPDADPYEDMYARVDNLLMVQARL